MIDYTDVDAKLEEYSEAFDFYMECGEMPPSMPPDDCLAGYMQEVIDNNPQIDGSDETWVEVLKEDMISFFTALLEQFRAMQIEAMKELAMITRFREATIEEKREMWQEVCGTIEAGYSKYDVNLSGYTAQFKTDDKGAVFSAMTSDWENACKAKLDRKERQMLNRAKMRFEQFCRDAGTGDYEDRKKVENYVHRYPQLREIVDMIGRDKDPSKEEKDTVVYRFMPTTVAKTARSKRLTELSQATIWNVSYQWNYLCRKISSLRDMQPRSFSSFQVPAKTNRKDRGTSQRPTTDKRTDYCKHRHQWFDVGTTSKDCFLVAQTVAQDGKETETPLLSDQLLCQVKVY